MSVRMKTAKYARPRMSTADFGPPAKYARPDSWGPPAGRGNRGVSGPVGGLPGRTREKASPHGKMIDLSPDEYQWMPERVRIPRTSREKRRFLDAMRRAFQTGKVLARFAPWVRAIDTALDLYDLAMWATKAFQPAVVTFPPGFVCQSYKASIDNPQPSCGYEYKMYTYNPGGSTNCSSWHYQHQGFAYFSPTSHRLVAVGPVDAGVYGCKRYSLAYVAIYPTKISDYGMPTLVQPQAPRTLLAPMAFPEPVWQESGYGRVPSQPDLKPYEKPADSMAPPNYGKPTWFPDRHAELPPARKRDEKKGKSPVPMPFKALGAAYGAATEAQDFLDAMYEGLPDKYKRGWHGGKDKVKALWDHWDEWDWKKAAEALAENQFQDWAIGKANQLANKAVTSNKYYRSPVGIGTGGWAQRNATSLPMVKMK